VDRLSRPTGWRKLGAALAAGALTAGGLVATANTFAPAPAARAEQNAPGVPVSFDNSFYAYVAEGETLDVDFTKFADVGTGGAGLEYRLTITDPAGNVAYSSTFAADAPIGASQGQAGLTGPAGAWKVSLTPGVGTGQSTFDWDITVREGGAAQTGRVWSYGYGVIQNDSVQRDLNYTVLNDTGYRYEIDLRDYNGIGSRIIANSLGLTGENDEPLYQSINGGSLSAQYTGPQYRLFFEDPSSALPATTPSADGELMVAPPLLTSADLAVDDLTFTPDSFNSGSGAFSYSINDRFSGAYELQIDTDGDGAYDDTVDRIIPLGADGSGSYTYDFDGLDGEGNPVADCTQMNARIFFEKLGEIHVLQVDVEARTGGIEITRLNGSGSPDSTVYWDDTALTGDRANTTPVLDGTAGVDSAGGVHGWAQDGNSWGNNRTIDDWAYDPIAFSAAEISIGGRCLDIEKTSDADDDTRIGDTVTYTVTATNTGDTDYTAEEPATVTDDLSGVLDDATYNDDASADRDGTIAYTEPKLSWTGALAAGDTVALTYTVELTAGGDGVIRNVAYGGTPEDPTPVCDPPNEEGVDPETDVPCAETEQELPRLSIEKTSDTVDLPADGGVVTYEVTITNEGPGVYTETAPATATDDLSDVLDDGEFGDILAPATGAVFDQEAQEITWSGPLGVDESVTIEYTVTYDAFSGDNVLLNTACIPAGDALPGAEACDTVRIPAAELEVTKSVDPADGSSVAAGQEVTYTLSFASIGQTAATVDKVDDLSDVFDDATLVEGSLSTSNDALVATLDGDALSVTGEVPAGETYTVTYTVLVNDYDEQANHLLANVVQNPDGTCDPDGCPETENPVRHFIVTKSATPTEGVMPGDTVEYTITVTNDGEGDYTDEVPAGVTDDMTDVLDDAVYNADAVAVASDGSTVPAPTFESPVLAWAGPLAAGETVEITFTVTVSNQGDYDLVNVATPDCVEGEICEPPTPVVEIDLPHIVPSKSSDPASGATVEPGQIISYTLSWTNDGKAAGPLDSTDDLSSVLDDAELTGEPVVDEAHADSVTAEFDADAENIRITGELAAGETTTVTYQVTVLADDERGDNALRNVVTQDTPPETCEEGDCPPPPATEHFVPEIVDSKSVDPASGSTVEPGQELTYTLTFTNEGAAAGTVDRVDDLTHVLDDADVTVQPAASDGTLTVSPVEDNRFSIMGELAAGQTVTVSYTVVVKAAEALGDRQLANFLLDNDPTVPTPDPEDCVDGEDCTYNPVPDIIDSKSVDPASGTTAQPGQTLTYTLTFENIGEAEGAVNRVDDLTHVLDDADVTGAPVASDPALSVSEIEESRFAITGRLAPGQTATVTYAVTVKAADELGDSQLANFLLDNDPTVPTPEPEDCVDGEDCTYNPVPNIVDSKSVNPASSTSVRAGETLTYTLTFENNGAAAGAVDRVDDLTHVLDDADVTAAPAASDPALAVSEIADGRFSIAGELAAGQTVTVTYAVTVKASEEMADAELANFLLDPSDPSPTEPVCTDREDCTYNPVSDVAVTKTADPASGTEVSVGQDVAYTLTFENTGAAAEAIAYTDHMAGVLDDADLVSAPTASDAALTVSDFVGGEFTVAGELGAGETVTVTYTVTVRDWAQQSDHMLGNVVAVAGQDPPAECAPDSTLCTDHPVEEPPALADPVDPASPPLAATGSDLASTVLMGVLGMLILGGGAMLFGRGRRASQNVESGGNS
jgi:fimbrial isopeptide formation D2 family protein